MINITNPERFLDFFTAIKSFRSPFRSFLQKEMTDLPTLLYTSGLEITAGSVDNVWTDWGVDQSTFHLASYADRSQPVVLKMTNKNFHAIQLFQLLCSEWLCITEL